MNEATSIKKLRSMIPTFSCKPGCHDCCGPVVFSKWEWEQVADKKTATCIFCPYASFLGCEIYEHRPIICRLFGTIDRLKCPRGCRPEVLLTEEEAAAIMEEYLKWV